MARALKQQSSWSQMKNLERAVERVSSWPEWKRTAFNYRSDERQGESAPESAEAQDGAHCSKRKEE
jgi:hypothetical protein